MNKGVLCAILLIFEGISTFAHFAAANTAKTPSHVSYGEFCSSKNRPCDTKALLACQNGICTCSDRNKVYFENEHTCLALVGGNCNNNIAKQCVPNATCKPRGFFAYCECDEYFENTLNGTCIESTGLNQRCNSMWDCRSDILLDCINKTCQCNPEKSAVEQSSKTFPCGFAGYDGQCGDKSLTTTTCHSDFVCRDGKCKCSFDEKHQFYDREKMSCRSFAQCTQNAECLSSGPKSPNFLECQCSFPYVRNEQGKCTDVAFSANCTSDMN